MSGVTEMLKVLKEMLRLAEDLDHAHRVLERLSAWELENDRRISRLEGRGDEGGRRVADPAAPSKVGG